MVKLISQLILDLICTTTQLFAIQRQPSLTSLSEIFPLLKWSLVSHNLQLRLCSTHKGEFANPGIEWNEMQSFWVNPPLSPFFKWLSVMCCCVLFKALWKAKKQIQKRLNTVGLYQDTKWSFILRSISQTRVYENSLGYIVSAIASCMSLQNIPSLILQLRMTLVREKKNMHMPQGNDQSCYASLRPILLWSAEYHFLNPPKYTLYHRCFFCLTS